MTTTEAAARLGCSREWVRYLCQRGRIRAAFIGRDWHIAETDLPKSLADVPRLPMGRPRKHTTGEQS
jgi:excisionase family DNA binding protein